MMGRNHSNFDTFVKSMDGRSKWMPMEEKSLAFLIVPKLRWRDSGSIRNLLKGPENSRNFSDQEIIRASSLQNICL